ncbi:MAG: presenilin family intramembrane aspartyl protease [Candidatus Bathyarchaeia archaeon]
MFPETPVGASLNSLVFILPLFLAAVIILLLIRTGRVDVVKFLVRGSLVSVTFSLILWYAWKMLEVTPPYFSDPYPFVMASASINSAIMFFMYNRGGLTRTLSMASVGAFIGSFLAHSIPFLSAVTLLGALAVYDILSVYKGPIGRLVKRMELKDFEGAVFTVRDVEIGMGDIVFYSMLVSVALLDFGIPCYLLSSIGTLLGAFLGIKVLETRDYFPGLPLAISVGLFMMLTSALLTGQLVW